VLFTPSPMNSRLSAQQRGTPSLQLDHSRVIAGTPEVHVHTSVTDSVGLTRTRSARRDPFLVVSLASDGRVVNVMGETSRPSTREGGWLPVPNLQRVGMMNGGVC
jgi:hypothetical protein